MVAKTVSVSLLLCILAVQRLFAQSGPDNDAVALRGLSGGFSGDIDSIQPFNGQLAIPIAVGPSYPVGPNLRFQAVLTYNSRVWEFGHPSTQSAQFAYTPIAGNPALGIGWDFSLGAVKLCTSASDYCYFGPDGSQHIFNEADAKRGTNFFKSSDGSRLSLLNKGTSGFEMWDELGNHYIFGWQVTGYDDSFSDFRRDFGRGRNGWYLTKLEDPFLNNFLVTYFSNTSTDSNSPCWSYTTVTNVVAQMLCPSYTTAPNSWIPSKVTVPMTSGTQDITVSLDGTRMLTRFC